MKYPILLFDADNTILDFTKAEECALIKTMKSHGYPYDVVVKKSYDTINHALWRQYELGEITRDEVVYTRFGKLFEKIGVAGDGITFEKEYQKALGSGSYVLDGALELLENLKKEEDCQCYIVTNGIAETQNRRLEESGVVRFIDRVFISEELGCQKPLKQFFDIVFAAIGKEKKAETLIIGDTLSSDILGGNNAGIKTCWYNPNQLINTTEAVVNYEIAEFHELYEILDIK